MKVIRVVLLGLATLAGGALALQALRAESRSQTDIPRSLREEHREIHAQLEQAVLRKDIVGAAARELAKQLRPHFVREEQIALRQLGALHGLTIDVAPADADVLVAMSDSLAKELPRMLEEHKMIARAVTQLETAAKAAGAADWTRFAVLLRRHALAEEEIYYPAALVVGRTLSRTLQP